MAIVMTIPQFLGPAWACKKHVHVREYSPGLSLPAPDARQTLHWRITRGQVTRPASS
jgi:hypothetical protein